MATHAHTPPNPTRRRALLGGAAAVVIGSGITAGAAASVADLVPSNPDAELLTLCPRLNIAVRDATARPA